MDWVPTLVAFGTIDPPQNQNPAGRSLLPYVPRCAILSAGSTEASGSETPRVHRARRWRGGGVAARGAVAGGATAWKTLADWSAVWLTCTERRPLHRAWELSARHAGAWLY